MSAPGRRGRRAMIGVAIVAALLVGGDRIAAWIATDTIAERLQTELASAEPPRVNVGGWPFLTQVAARNLDSVTVRTTAYRAEDVLLDSVDVTLHDVWRNGSAVTADRLDGTATVSLAEVQRLAGDAIQLSLAADGLVASGTWQGRRVSGAVAVAIEGSQVRFTTRITGPVSARLPAVSVPVPELPFNLKLTAVAVVGDGLQFTGAARDVELR